MLYKHAHILPVVILVLVPMRVIPSIAGFAILGPVIHIYTIIILAVMLTILSNSTIRLSTILRSVFIASLINLICVLVLHPYTGALLPLLSIFILEPCWATPPFPPMPDLSHTPTPASQMITAVYPATVNCLLERMGFPIEVRKIIVWHTFPRYRRADGVYQLAPYFHYPPRNN